MTTITAITTTIERPGGEFAVDPAELAAIAFLARYSGRTLAAYRHDLRTCSSGPPITIWAYWKRRGLTWFVPHLDGGARIRSVGDRPARVIATVIASRGVTALTRPCS